MELFQLSRSNMADFLVALKGEGDQTPLTVLQSAWANSHQNEVHNGTSLPAFMETKMPAVFEKFIKENKSKIGFSINEIVMLGNQIEFTNLSPTAVQNWVKRDVKNLIGSPQLGKKYTVDQAAILLIIEDLKSSLDFESIRKVLTLVFNNPADRTDDVIDPLTLYAAYASIFEKIHHERLIPGDISVPINLQIEEFIKKESETLIPTFTGLNEEQRNIVLNVLIMTTLTVLSSYYQTLTKQYMTATLFLNGI
ncbi:DUF1836 domain-containing protein [Bacillus sp. 31A1R]|uniref:DUF1836 domain-containing protein n=1 Tax=Robertmurraya mangrovi TaxID=3098077 RepID=A0ABU5J2J0_9BACI|nr:DUF1836 domain-containing protein [Bacillus sp. 31A1R]MDZ5473576.1 DUF1836 domain-containing protein [Bacillus sp. 31A1R]